MKSQTISSSITAEGLSAYVDPFIGTRGGGSVFPGAMLPFGMVKLGPDCEGHFNSGYTWDTKLQGFSHTHISGAGGGAKYGNILVVPTTGKLNVETYGSMRANEVAHPGYYKVDMTDYQVTAELTATSSTGFHQYTFQKGGESNILIDAGHYLIFGQVFGEGPTGEAQDFVGSEVQILSSTEITGYSRVRGGWNYGGPYTVYFYAIFDTPAKEFGTWKNGKIEKGSKQQFDSGEKTGAFFTFDTEAGQIIRVKVGISFISSLKARENLEKENSSWDFSSVYKNAMKIWNDALRKIEVQTLSNDQKKLFYTALYHCLLMPTDRTGENPKWRSSEPYYDDYYAIWDTYRATYPLYTLIMESKQVDIVRSLIDIFRYEGYMPDARSGNDNGRTQGGSNCDIVIADAFVKGLKGIDYETAYKSMVKNAEIAPGGNERKEGRGGIDAYIALGYVPAESEIKKNKGFQSKLYERAGTRTIEYSACDFATATLAKGLGQHDDYLKYKKRASNWQNLWRPIADHGASGFIWPRRKDGSWIEDYSVFTGGSWGNFFYEGNSWEYSFSIPHDVKSLIERCGGKNAFIARLDTFFTNNYYQVSNEPGFLIPCLYNYVGRPDKTASQVKRIIKTHYNTTRAGIPGNDDSGAMSSWLVFHAMGFYPNAGQDVYLISSPLFSKSIVHLENGKDFTVEAKNLSDKNIYVQSASLNGKPLNQSWFRHTEIKNGGMLELVMGDKPTGWGQTNLPPSMSDN